ncbi:MAG TPA: heme peroxidase family protein [Gaiellaceae bacterium]|nr:heme peroxidase family protein [Gaiellaceae bacterium]
MDAKDDLSQGPIALITNPDLSKNNPDNPTHTAGTTFMGQFIDHDITFDTSSKLGVTTDPFTSPNGRTPALDLDSVYGDGPVGSPALYDPADHSKLLLGSGGTFADGSPGFEDLPRTGDGTAIVGDPRNDENMMIAGLHCAFIKFHNRQVDDARSNGLSYPDDYAQARQATTWHYQWLVLHEFLPLFVGSDLAGDVLQNGRRFYTVGLGQGFMPVEFQGACYRFGHSMVRPSYRANLKGNEDGSPFFGFIFDPGQNAVTPDPSDLRGIGCHAPRRFIGWQTFFDFGDGNVKRNKQIDTHISSPLFTLPLGTIASHDQPTVLPQRNLLRQVTWSLPSGQSIAAAMGATPLINPELKKYGFDLHKSTPLWYYALKEAQVAASGLHLGPVAGRIVAEVLVGLIQSDPNSYLNASPSWTPTAPISNAGLGFRMVDFLTYAGVDPASRHAQNPAHA